MVTRFSQGIPAQIALATGMICLSLSILTERFLPTTSGTEFLAGLLLGLSLVMNFWGLFRWRPQHARTRG